MNPACAFCGGTGVLIDTNSVEPCLCHDSLPIGIEGSDAPWPEPATESVADIIDEYRRRGDRIVFNRPEA